MDLHSEIILEAYKENYPLYEKIKEIVDKSLDGIISSLNMVVNTIESRIKTEKSLKGKLELKGYKYKDIYAITDLVGARVVTFYSSDVDKVAAKVEKVFDIDWKNTTDKRKAYKIDQFGYMSLHYICSIPKKLYFDENHPEINTIRFEVQLRTVLQHAWASIYHDTGYKSDVEVPANYLRSLTRLAGLLELADDEFDSIKTGLDEYRKRVKNIISTGDFKDVELNKDSFLAFLGAGGFDKINKHIASINNMDIENVSLTAFLPFFKRYDFATLGDVQNLIDTFGEEAYKLAVRQLDGQDIDIISSALGPQTLCIVFLLKKGYGEGAIASLLDDLHGPLKSHEKYAAKIIEHAKACGII